MTPPSNKPRLRNALKKLYAAGIDWSDRYTAATAAQEAIDFVAMLAGLKPVYVLGRGFDHEGWRRQVVALARAHGLHVVEGPYWEAVPAPDDLPDWFTAPSRRRIGEGRALYVTKARTTAAEVEAVCATGQPTIEQEARLLGFPECCVAAHYETAAALERATFAILERHAGGVEAEMRRLAESDTPILPRDDDERALMAQAIAVRPAPHTSLNMCAACADAPESPAKMLSDSYRALARSLSGSRARG